MDRIISGKLQAAIDQAIKDGLIEIESADYDFYILTSKGYSLAFEILKPIIEEETEYKAASKLSSILGRQELSSLTNSAYLKRAIESTVEKINGHELSFYKDGITDYLYFRIQSDFVDMVALNEFQRAIYNKEDFILAVDFLSDIKLIEKLKYLVSKCDNSGRTPQSINSFGDFLKNPNKAEKVEQALFNTGFIDSNRQWKATNTPAPKHVIKNLCICLKSKGMIKEKTHDLALIKFLLKYYNAPYNEGDLSNISRLSDNPAYYIYKRIEPEVIRIISLP